MLLLLVPTASFTGRERLLQLEVAKYWTLVQDKINHVFHVFIACANQNTCMILSAFSSRSLEDVARASGEGLRWFHLEITMPDNVVKEHVERAEKAGYKALVITVDQPNVGVHRKYEHIMNKNHLISFANFNIPSNSMNANYLRATRLSCPITWDRIEWVRSLSTLPIVLKGILTADDALLALEHKIDGIIVSNHGGRQLDCVPATVSE